MNFVSEVHFFNHLSVLIYICQSFSSCLLSTVSCTAVAVNSKLEYDVVEVESLNGHASSSGETRKKRLGVVLKDEKKLFLIVASELVPKLEAKWGVKLVVKRRLLGSDLENYRLLAIPK